MDFRSLMTGLCDVLPVSSFLLQGARAHSSCFPPGSLHQMPGLSQLGEEPCGTCRGFWKETVPREKRVTTVT